MSLREGTAAAQESDGPAAAMALGHHEFRMTKFYRSAWARCRDPVQRAIGSEDDQPAQVNR